MFKCNAIQFNKNSRTHYVHETNSTRQQKEREPATVDNKNLHFRC